MWTTFMWLAIFGAVCSASMDMDADDSSKLSSDDLLQFNIGEFQGMVFCSHISKHIDHVDDMTTLGTTNNSMDVLAGDYGMIYRIPHLSSSAAQNLSLVNYKITRMMAAPLVTGINENCNALDFSLDLVTLIKLAGRFHVCSGPNGYWSLAGKPCVNVAGFDLGCTDINLASDNVKYCWSVNLGLAKASICASVKNNCLGFSGEGCHFSFPGWSCKDFDARATCW